MSTTEIQSAATVDANTIQSKWESYRRDVVPENASEAQVIETRKGFYAGASAFLSITLKASDEGKSEEAGAAIMQGVYEEIEAFFGEVQAGRA